MKIMPSNLQIQQEANPSGGPASVLSKYMKKFQERTGRNLIIYDSGFLFTNGNVSIVDQDMEGFMEAVCKMDKKRGLDIFIHTPGGSVAATEGIGDYLRSVFDNNIECYIPHMAMSCGTLLAMACRKIYMGKHSCLGPIDPAIGNYRTDAVSEEFENAKKDIEKNPNLALLWQPIISKYPITFLGECKKATELAVIVSQKWLQGGMLKKSRNKSNALGKIKNLFATHNTSKSHDRHISAYEAKNAGLNVELIEKDADLQDAVLSIHHAANLFMKREELARGVANTEGIGLFVKAAAKT